MPSECSVSELPNVNARTPQPPLQDITAAILAGGRGTRLGGADKGLEKLSGRPLVAHIIAALVPQCGTLLINANRNQPRYAAFGYPVVNDDNDDYLGPLAGMLSVLRAARTRHVLCVPCDAPLLPADLTTRLWRALTDKQAQASPGTSVCPGGTGELAGTGFDAPGTYCAAPSSGGGATGWLTSTAPVTPGEVITLEFMVWDTGDANLDSSVLIDHFTWVPTAGSTTPVETGTQRPPN